jgi:hypothetical protein
MHTESHIFIIYSNVVTILETNYFYFVSVLRLKRKQ